MDWHFQCVDRFERPQQCTFFDGEKGNIRMGITGVSSTDALWMAKGAEPESPPPKSFLNQKSKELLERKAKGRTQRKNNKELVRDSVEKYGLIKIPARSNRKQRGPQPAAGLHYFSRRRKRAGKACRIFHGEIVASKTMAVLESHETAGFEEKLGSYTVENDSIKVLEEAEDPAFERKLLQAQASSSTVTQAENLRMSPRLEGIENAMGSIKLKNKAEMLAEVQQRLVKDNDEPNSPTHSEEEEEFDRISAQAKTVLENSQQNRERFGPVLSVADLMGGAAAASVSVPAAAASVPAPAPAATPPPVYSAAHSAHSANEQSVPKSYGADDFDHGDESDTEDTAATATAATAAIATATDGKSEAMNATSMTYGTDEFDDEDDSDSYDQDDNHRGQQNLKVSGTGTTADDNERSGGDGNKTSGDSDKTSSDGGDDGGDDGEGYGGESDFDMASDSDDSGFSGGFNSNDR
jgi:hypothetical protein